MHANDPYRQRRQNFLALFLTALGLLFFLTVLVFLSGGFFLYVVLVAGGMACYGLFHYLLWGKMLSQEVAGEREEEQLRRRAAA